MLSAAGSAYNPLSSANLPTYSNMGDDSDNDDEMVDFVDSSDDDNTGRGAGIGAGREEASDDPPLRAGPNATTMGFEFELCVAVATNTKMMPDPHPNDGRWISDHLIERSHESLSYKYTARNKLVDTLVAHGVPAQKNPENCKCHFLILSSSFILFLFIFLVNSGLQNGAVVFHIKTLSPLSKISVGLLFPYVLYMFRPGPLIMTSFILSEDHHRVLGIRR